MRYNEPSPLEVMAISYRFDLPNSASIDTYLANDGYVAIKKCLEMTPEAIIDVLKASSFARPRRCGLSHWNEVELCSAHDGQTDLYCLQFGRERAWHMQRPLVDGERSASTD